MQFSLLQVVCPNCSSTDITYTCEPKCCFNHVCNNCHSSFMLATHKLGQELAPADRAGLPAEGPSDPLAPCVGCERCESTAVYRIEDDPSKSYVCGSCFALLRFAIEDVVQN